MKKHTQPILEKPRNCKKKSYSFAQAHRNINLAHSPNYEDIKRARKIPQRAYYCQLCNTWHLTSRKQPIDLTLIPISQ